MKYILLSVLFLFVQTDFSLLRKVDTEATILKVDQLANVYLVEGDVLQKFDASGNLIFSFSRSDYGSISSLDVSDPLKPNVFYKDYGKFIVLDNSLSEQSDPIDLFSRFSGNITLACQSSDAHYWFYDESNFELHRVNSRFEIVYSSGNISAMLGKIITPESLIEKDNFVYLNDSHYGVIKFDIYASYVKTLFIENAMNPRYYGDEVFFNSADSLFIYNSMTFETQFIKLPSKSESEVHVVARKMYYISDNSLEIYSY